VSEYAAGIGSRATCCLRKRQPQLMDAIRLPGYDGIQPEENLITNYANNCPNCSVCIEISSRHEP